MREVTFAATQMTCGWDVEENIEKAEGLVRKAAGQGANVILLQELFSTVYFCQVCDYHYFSWACELEKDPMLKRMQALAKELKVVLPVSFFEKANQMYYNTVAVIDADGEHLGIYRKSHIPEDPGYQEKFYFAPGNTGFRVWDTQYGKLGIGICWDQWFPEPARCMVLAGAEVLLYPTAIGTEPMSKDRLADAELIHRRWQNAMLGHAVHNMVPVLASNRVGIEDVGSTSIKFFGSSFISDAYGEIIARANTQDEGVILATLDLDAVPPLKCLRFRDRRTDLYGPLLSQDGK